MDRLRFDALARRLATRKTRRTTLKALAGCPLGVAAGGLLGLAGPVDVAANRCKRAGKPCQKDHRCCAGLVCAARRCQAEAGRTPCGSDNPCPSYFQTICGLTRDIVLVDNPCLGGFCALTSPPPADPCCQCANGGACVVSDGSCCAVEQVCQDKKGNHFCCPGTEFCGTGRKGVAACLSSDRACLPDDTGACFPDESCAAGVCCPTERACPDQCCAFDCVCQGGVQCLCGLQAGVRRF